MNITYSNESETLTEHINRLTKEACVMDKNVTAQQLIDEVR